MIPTYGRVLSVIEKVLQELIEEYQGVGKFLWDLVEGQEKNIAQLKRIGAAVKQRWGLKKGEIKGDGDDKKRSKDSPRKSQEKGTLSVSY